jgi:hypothetical protein
MQDVDLVFIGAQHLQGVDNRLHGAIYICLEDQVQFHSLACLQPAKDLIPG